MSKYGMGYSIISKKILIGKLNKKNNRYLDKEYLDENKFYKAVIKFFKDQLKKGTDTLEITNNGKFEFEVSFKKDSNKTLKKTYEYAKKFVDKVESGKARSKETYADMKELMGIIEKSKILD